MKKIDKAELLKAINLEEKLEREDAYACCWLLAEKYLENDINQFASYQIEVPGQFYGENSNPNTDTNPSPNTTGQSLRGREPLAEGTLDLTGELGKPITWADKYKGCKFVVDWKTANKALDSDWKKRYVGSWQWRFYAAMVGARLFEYRGISRITGEVESVFLEVPEDNNKNVTEYLNQITRMRESLRGESIWPRHMPFACLSYGRECPFYSNEKAGCKFGKPVYIGIPDNKPFHYTDSEVFMLCPERYRQLAVMTKVTGSGDETSYTQFGGAVHRGMAYIYGLFKKS